MYEDTLAEQPLDEVQMHRIQRAASDIQRRALTWADRILDLLPRGIQLDEDEAELLRLFLAQQRRLNLQLDGSDGNEGFLSRIAIKLSILQPEDRDVIIRAAHRLVFSSFQQAIEAAVERFCRQHDISPTEPPTIDWRVAVRYMAQQLHHIGRQLKLGGDSSLASPIRFELIATARDLATDVVAKRTQLLDSCVDSKASTRSTA
jgi:hypothetical protein